VEACTTYWYGDQLWMALDMWSGICEEINGQRRIKRNGRFWARSLLLRMVDGI
jgi:hypothetical protein